MNCNKLILLVLFVALSCKKQTPNKVWLCNNEGAITLIGKVKEMIIGNDQYFYKAHFDEKGDLKYTVNRYLTEWEDDTGKHSDVTALTTNYNTQYDKSGNRHAILAQWQGDIRKSKWEFNSEGRIIDFIDDIKAPKGCTTSYFQYDLNDNIIEYKRIRCVAVEPPLYKYKYDANHLVIESLFYEGDVFLSKTVFKYQSFDSNNNWTKCITHTRRYPPMIASYRVDTIIRKITYY